MISNCFELKENVITVFCFVCVYVMCVCGCDKNEKLNIRLSLWSFVLLACECSKVGITGENCDKTGQCNCKPFFTGMKCSNCQKGYYLNKTQKECLGKNGVSNFEFIYNYIIVSKCTTHLSFFLLSFFFFFCMMVDYCKI